MKRDGYRGKVDAVAFYLPQFHPVPENDEWWGAGFSEWRNVARARPLFRGHYQPNLPGALGFYDLRLHETHEAQIALAKGAGLTAFCFYHYWFDGKKILEKPVELFRDAKDLDFRYFLCWANHSWTGHWAGRGEDVLLEQTYPGERDDRAHYEYLRTFFADNRYYTRNARPVLGIFKPEAIPDFEGMCRRLNELAKADGLSGLFIIAHTSDRKYLALGADAIAPHALNDAVKKYLTPYRTVVQALAARLLRRPRWTIEYDSIAKHFRDSQADGQLRIPTAVPNWDNTPRVGRRGMVFKNSSPTKFLEQLRNCTLAFSAARQSNPNMLFVKSWNEWAEGNYLEPDLRFGTLWLDAIKTHLDELANAGEREPALADDQSGSRFRAVA